MPPQNVPDDATPTASLDMPLSKAFAEFCAYKSRNSKATLKAYRNDFDKVCDHIAPQLDKPVGDLTLADITGRANLRNAFNACFSQAPRSSYSRARSTWTSFCNFLVTDDYLPATPMNHVDKPGSKRSLAPPKAIETADVNRLLTQLAMPDPDDVHGWRERDLALVLAGLLLGLRTTEIINLDIGNFTPRHDNPAAMTLQVRGKGDEHRTLVSEPPLTRILEAYLASRSKRYPDTIPPGRRSRTKPWRRFDPTQPLFVGSDGQRITRGTLQYRIKRAYSRAGIITTRGAHTHRLRHTFAMQLAETGVPVHTLMDLLGHASMATTQRYLQASGQATRAAASTNPIYQQVPPPQ